MTATGKAKAANSKYEKEKNLVPVMWVKKSFVTESCGRRKVRHRNSCESADVHTCHWTVKSWWDY